MSERHTGNIQPQLDLEEHVGLADAKRVVIVGNDGGGYNELKVNADGSIDGGGGGGGSGVQYTEGATDSSVTGTAIMWRDVGDVMEPVTGTTPLPVNIVAGSSSGVTFDDGDAIDTDSQGTLLIGSDGMPGTARVLRTAADGSVRVDPTGTTAQPVTDNGGSLTVDGTVTIQDGGNVITVDGTVAVTQSTSPWVIGDGAGSITVDGPVTDAQLRATPVPVSGTVSVTEPVSVDDNGGSLTVDGTVAATQGTSPWVVGDGGSSITVDGTVAATQGTSPWVVSGSFSSTPAVASTATLTNVNASTSSVQLLAANANRLGAFFFNDSSGNLFLKLGTTASTTSFTVRMISKAYYELPGPSIYTGRIDGIWSNTNLAVRITELSA